MAEGGVTIERREDREYKGLLSDAVLGARIVGSICREEGVNRSRNGDAATLDARGIEGDDCFAPTASDMGLIA